MTIDPVRFNHLGKGNSAGLPGFADMAGKDALSDGRRSGVSELANLHSIRLN